MLRRIASGVIFILLLAMGGFAVLAWRSEIPAVDVSPARFDTALIQRGAHLAAIGDCDVCHTAPLGKPFAGGRPLDTPFGTIFTSNITPDGETGIGRWPEAAFLRAMNEGVDRRGTHLYPAFPYDHFTLVSDDDNRALYAFLMTRDPVRAIPPPNDLPFPFNLRILLAGWKLLFLHERRFQPDPAASEQINRGAYLVEGLGHCGACHTPRNVLGAERPGKALSGGEAEGWVAYAIDGASPAPVPWSQASLASYLGQGWHVQHGVSRGPMTSVTADLGGLAQSDVAAIAAYVADRMGPSTPEREQRAQAALRQADAGSAPPTSGGDQQAPTRSAQTTGAALYAGACAPCHESGRAPPFGGLPFALSTAVHAPDPQNVINVVLYGLPAPDGERGAIMPGFAGALDDKQIAALLAFVRERFGSGPAWTELEAKARATRTGAHKVSLYRSDGTSSAPADVAQRTNP